VLGQTYVILFKQSLCLCSCVMSLTNSLCVSLRLLVISSLWTMPPIARPSWPETFFEPERERSRSPRRVQPGTISPRTPPSTLRMIGGKVKVVKCPPAVCIFFVRCLCGDVINLYMSEVHSSLQNNSFQNQYDTCRGCYKFYYDYYGWRVMGG
jgi:hypothetical protein